MNQQIADEKCLLRDRMKMVSAFLMMAAFLGAFIWFVVFLVDRKNTVVSSESVGNLQDATFHRGVVSDSTAVRTDKGTFLVGGIFQAMTGQPIEIRTMKNEDRRLCDATTNVCKLLLN